MKILDVSTSLFDSSNNNSVDDFLHFAKIYEELDFLMTVIGCGMAGFTLEKISLLFVYAIEDDIKDVCFGEVFCEMLKDL